MPPLRPLLLRPPTPELFHVPSGELQRVFPPELQQDESEFHKAKLAAPRALRAMSAIYALDVSTALEDVIWHSANRPDEQQQQKIAYARKYPGQYVSQAT